MQPLRSVAALLQRLVDKIDPHEGRYRMLEWLGARAQAGVAAPFTRPLYVLDNVGTVYQSDVIAFRGAVGLEAYF